ncbi:protein FAM200A-like [Larimichthys crocea]|uniref:protein FAM200A-like n=1 Tax=Larimichthys crocea TaxID=215358 RepID=UPI000F5E4AA7|nr:protein FAM200A-like [Larimichthys crocea]
MRPTAMTPNPLDRLTYPQIDVNISRELGGPISLLEVHEAINSMQNRKSPGPDGFTVEVFKAYSMLLAPILVQMFNDSFTEGRLPGWMRDPFQNDDVLLPSKQDDQLIELRNDGGLKTLFDSTSLSSFWIKATGGYNEISTLALKTLFPFPTSYLCEAGFSAMTITKTRLRSRLNVRTLRVSLSPITPRPPPNCPGDHRLLLNNGCVSGVEKYQISVIRSAKGGQWSSMLP